MKELKPRTPTQSRKHAAMAREVLRLHSRGYDVASICVHTNTRASKVLEIINQQPKPWQQKRESRLMWGG